MEKERRIKRKDRDGTMQIRGKGLDIPQIVDVPRFNGFTTRVKVVFTLYPDVTTFQEL